MTKNIFKSTALTAALLAATVFSGSVMAQTPAPAATPATSKEAPKTAAKAPAVAVSDADIAAAKTKGMVWVNTNTKVYHSDGEFYGKTKQGKFMTKADADKAGFRAAKEPVAKAKTVKTDKK